MEHELYTAYCSLPKISGALYISDWFELFPKFELSELDSNRLDDSGVYFLLRKDVVVYVGSTKNTAKSRIFGDTNYLSLEPHINKGWAFDSIKVLPFNDTPTKIIRSIEAMYISMFQPHYNRIGRNGHNVYKFLGDIYKRDRIRIIEWIEDIKFKYVSETVKRRESLRHGA